MNLRTWSLATAIIVSSAALAAASVRVRGVAPPTPSTGVHTADNAASACQVAYDAPSPGYRVGRRHMIEGRARVGAGQHLWLLVSILGQDGNYWPQGGGPARLVDGRFRVLANFGGSTDDIGLEFVVSAVVVDDGTSRELKAWVERNTLSGQWPPLTNFPNVVDKCPVRELRVIKASH